MIQLPQKRIVVTGGAGFLGSHLTRRLERMGCRNVFVPLYPDYDLTRIDSVERLLTEHPPEVLIHLAAVVGGIGANRANPGRFFYDNAILDASKRMANFMSVEYAVTTPLRRPA